MDKANKQYIPLENILNKVLSKHIALPENEEKRNNAILSEVLNLLINKMRACDLFDGLFERYFYGGSYYDKLKISSPNEYDIDLVLNVPAVVEAVVLCTDQPGFVNIEITKFDKILTRPELEKKKFETIRRFLDESNFMCTSKVLKWMESIVNLTLNTLGQPKICVTENGKVIEISIRIKKSGPAFTLELSGTDSNGCDIFMDVDLVPCFQFKHECWPNKHSGYRENPCPTLNKFLVVPKKPNVTDLKSRERYWRLSFQEQERELLNELNFLKPSMKLLKKLRDKHKQHSIASYYIKTVFLWTLHEKEKDFWTGPLSVVFMTMLKKYSDYLSNQKIPYYWNQDHNLVGFMKSVTITDIANTIKNIVIDIERNLEQDPFVVVKYLLPESEYKDIIKEMLGSKTIKLNSDSKSDICRAVGKSDDSMLTDLKNQLQSMEQKQDIKMDTIISLLNNKNITSCENVNNMAILEQNKKKLENVLDKVNEIHTVLHSVQDILFNIEDKTKSLLVEIETLKNGYL